MNDTISPKAMDTQQHILDVAKEIILRKGFAAAGLNEILTEAKVPKGSFYHYFKSKEQFGDALLQNYFERYLHELDKTLTMPNLTEVERLMAYFQSWLDRQCSDVTNDKCLVVKLSGEVTDLSELMRITLKQGTDLVIDRLTQCFEAAIERGELPASLNARTMTAEIYYMWIGATLLTKVGHAREPLALAMAATKTRLGLK